MNVLTVQNHRPFRISELPFLAITDFENTVRTLLKNDHRMIALMDLEEDANGIKVLAVLSDSAGGLISITGTVFDNRDKNFNSFAPDYPQTHYFECELAEQTGIVPIGHPWLRPVRRQDTILNDRPYEFYRLDGEEVHEVAVGPIHAGVIEPGHFRFQCHGETVYHLEINLGYQHRGVESLMVQGNPAQRMILAESVAGDTVIGHGMAYALGAEALSECRVSLRAQYIRVLAEELERAAMHIAGLSGVTNDIGLAIAASAYGRLRTLVINSLGLLCGSRFGRGLITPGGVQYDVQAANTQAIRQYLTTVLNDIQPINDYVFNATGVLGRLEHTGVVTRDWAESAGLVGPSARACGVITDTRHQFPYGAYRYNSLPMLTLTSGDVYARARIRAMEINESLQFVMERLEDIPDGPLYVPPENPLPDSGVVSVVEGWRGEIVHAAFTDAHGRFRRYKIKDPSFHNWYGLALALRRQGISDFPLCNKSFDLSYAGHDL